MKTVEIVERLLVIAERAEFHIEDGECWECSGMLDHKPNCKIDEVMTAAKEYLRLMEGAKA